MSTGLDKSNSPTYYLPFKVDERQFEINAFKWLIEGAYTPDDILDSILRELINENNRLYLPCFVFYYEYTGNLSATLVFVSYTKYDVYNPNTKMNETKTQRIEKREPFANGISGNVNILVTARKEENTEFGNFVASFPWGDFAKKASTENPTNVREGNFEISSEWADANKARSLLKSHIFYHARKTLPKSDGVESLNVSSVEKLLDASKICLPAWLLNYSYGGKKYFFYCDGLTGLKTMGSRPEDLKKRNHVASYRNTYYFVAALLSFTIGFIYCNIGEEDYAYTWQGFFVSAGVFVFSTLVIEINVWRLKRKWKSIRSQKLNQKLREFGLSK